MRTDYGKNYPGLIASWERAWEEFIPFLAFDREIRRVIYTTNAIESLNYQLRKITKTRRLLRRRRRRRRHQAPLPRYPPHRRPPHRR
ncbi:transposase [Streptomyces sp. NBC_01017]|uniref:transposase n=1 Tax=Streptomyces sp. NBC_01017 TaxID=2903721 RepID=UPI00386BB4A1